VEKEGSSSSSVDAEQSGVRHRWLLQISRRGVEREKEMGGVGSVPRGGRETGEREGPGRGAKDAASNGPWPSGVCGGTVARTRVSGGARVTWRCATGMRGWVASEPGGSGRGTQEREEWGSAAMGC
jgi:hypothetical protein